jgi:hypothetical protein
MDWKQLNAGEWFLAIMDDASRFIVGYGVFKEATTVNTLQVLSLNWQNLETPIQAFHRKLPLDRKNLTQPIQDAK